ncbi:mastermind-like protein 2 [Biomphalaria pfeifferi]|uniref:Mastermind-like protein 2 n=1 Tax=Biomphalaria pfeifferi TaxID=112525 RepID=A0AAD8FIN3_BIOPF|nr:mastermind-like protein 2 [Biomphalaria pfeifferi]
MAIEVGAEFNTYEDLTNAIKAYEAANFVNLIIRDTRRVESAAKRNQRKCYNAAIKYSDISYCCTYGGKKYVSHSTGKRIHKTIKQSCPFSLKVRATVDGQRLFVREMSSLHNHEISEAEFRLHPKQRKLDIDSQEEIANLLCMEPDKKLLRDRLMQITGKVILMKDIHNIKTRLVNQKQKSPADKISFISKEDTLANNSTIELGEADIQQSSGVQHQVHSLCDVHLPLQNSSHLTIGDQHDIIDQQNQNDSPAERLCYIETQSYQQSSDSYSVNIQQYPTGSVYELTPHPYTVSIPIMQGNNILPSIEEINGHDITSTNTFQHWTAVEEIGRTTLHAGNYQTISTLTFSEHQNDLLSNEPQTLPSITVKLPSSDSSSSPSTNQPAYHEYAQDPQTQKLKKHRRKEQSKNNEKKKKKKSAVQTDKDNLVKKYFQQATVNLFFNERLKTPGNRFQKSLRQETQGGAPKMSESQYHEMLKPLSWLFGKWQSEAGKGEYPTISDFTYGEEAEFTPIGMKPMIEYKFYSWKPENKMQLHRETGFIRIKPETNHIAFMAAHNLGVVEIQEGEVQGQELIVQTTSLGRTSFNKPPEVKSVRRTLKRTGNELEQVMSMETNKTAMTQHLKITFKKVN